MIRDRLLAAATFLGDTASDTAKDLARQVLHQEMKQLRDAEDRVGQLELKLLDKCKVIEGLGKQLTEMRTERDRLKTQVADLEAIPEQKDAAEALRLLCSASREDSPVLLLGMIQRACALLAGGQPTEAPAATCLNPECFHNLRIDEVCDPMQPKETTRP